MILLIIIISWLISLIILLISLYFFTGSLFFTFMKENTIKAIVANGRLKRFISNVPNKQVDQSDYTLKPVSDVKKQEKFMRIRSIEVEKWLFENLGLRWVGIPLFNQVLTIPINRVVWAKNKAEVKSTLGRIIVDTKNTDELYHAFPRPIEMSEVDTLDGFRLDISLLAFIEVEMPYFAFFTLKDSFMFTLDSIIKGYVTEVIKSMSWEDFKAKKEAVNSSVPKNGLFDFDELSTRMKKGAGSIIPSLIVDDFNISPSSKNLQDAVEALKIAEEKGKASKKTSEYTRDSMKIIAEGERFKRTEEGEGDASAIKVIANAKATRYQELIDVYIRNGFSPKEASGKADEKIADEFKWENVGKMTGTYVEGGSTSVQPTVPINERRS